MFQGQAYRLFNIIEICYEFSSNQFRKWIELNCLCKEFNLEYELGTDDAQ